MFQYLYAYNIYGLVLVSFFSLVFSTLLTPWGDKYLRGANVSLTQYLN